MKDKKEYKIDLSMYRGKIREALSAAVQYHAFELGYRWESVGKEVSWTKSPYLFFDEGGVITHVGAGDAPYFNEHCGEEISVADFLALTQEEPEFKPFDRVLVRDFDDVVWIPHFYSHLNQKCTYIHRTVGDAGFSQCIPYEGNEHLLGTTGEPE
jgi:hypothetical protein